IRNPHIDPFDYARVDPEFSEGSKSETNLKSEFLKFQTFLFCSLLLLVIWICFVLRASNFGFLCQLLLDMFHQAPAVSFIEADKLDGDVMDAVRSNRLHAHDPGQDNDRFPA